MELTERIFNKRELHLSDIIPKAIDSTLNVEEVIFSQGNFLDIGKFDGLTRALIQHHGIIDKI